MSQPMAKAQALKLEGGRRERPSLGDGKRVWKKRLSAFLEGKCSVRLNLFPDGLK